MILWTTEEINLALNLKEKIEKKKFSGISIDSRTIKKGELFIPIKGNKFDGHDFLEEAFKNGANASLVELKKKKEINFNGDFYFVKNTMRSLSILAEFSRNRIRNLTTICITGSSGKTTLKEWIFKTFKDSKISYCTSGNFNNHIGMPLTLVNMPKTTQLCILELGMNSPGEIKKLTKIAKPNLSIITNIGSAHSGNFKHQKKIVEEKSKIFSFLDKNSVAILPHDSMYHKYMFLKAAKKTKKIFSFGMNKDSNIRIIKNNKKDSWTFAFYHELLEIKNKYSFINWPQNVAIICCVAMVLKIKIKEIIDTLENLKPLGGRGELLKLKTNDKLFSLIDESYNSNPESLSQAIKNLKNYKSENRRTICVIGDMLELGSNARDFHENISKVLIENEPDILISVGKYTKFMFDKLPQNFLKFHYMSYEKVLKKLLNIIQNKDIIMIKGSNSTKLHIVAKKLRRLV